MAGAGGRWRRSKDEEQEATVVLPAATLSSACATSCRPAWRAGEEAGISRSKLAKTENARLQGQRLCRL